MTLFLVIGGLVVVSGSVIWAALRDDLRFMIVGAIIGLAMFVVGIVLMDGSDRRECESSGGVYNSEITGFVPGAKGVMTPVVSAECVGVSE